MKFSCFFTLTELLFITVIICILASILLPAASSTVNRAKLAACSNHLRQIGTATIIYAQDNTGLIPNIMPGMEKNSIPIIRLPNRTFLALGRLLKAVYIPDIKIFGCPDSPGYTPEDVDNHWQSTAEVCSAYLYRSQCGNFTTRLYAPENLSKAYIMDLACVTIQGEEIAPHNYRVSNMVFPDCHTESRPNSREPLKNFTLQTPYTYLDTTPDSFIIWLHADSEL
jgi:type II secretory pathway pseudopilin PulG